MSKTAIRIYVILGLLNCFLAVWQWLAHDSLWEVAFSTFLGVSCLFIGRSEKRKRARSRLEDRPD